MARAVADDPRIYAFAGVAGYYSDAAAFAESSPQEYQAAIDRGHAAEKRWRETGEAEIDPSGRSGRRRRGDAAARGIRVSTARPAGQWTTTRTASPSSRSRIRRRSTPKRPRPGSGCRSSSSTPSTPSPHPSPAGSTPPFSTSKSELWLESQRSDRLLRRSPPHRPRRRRNRGALHDPGRLTTARSSRIAGRSVCVYGAAPDRHIGDAGRDSLRRRHNGAWPVTPSSRLRPCSMNMQAVRTASSNWSPVVEAEVAQVDAGLVSIHAPSTASRKRRAVRRSISTEIRPSRSSLPRVA